MQENACIFLHIQDGVPKTQSKYGLSFEICKKNYHEFHEKKEIRGVCVLKEIRRLREAPEHRYI